MKKIFLFIIILLAIATNAFFSTIYALTLNREGSFQVNAEIVPPESEFIFLLKLDKTNLSANDELTVTVEYNTLTNLSSFTGKIEVYWEKAKSKLGNYVEVFDYVSDSATTDDYTSTPIVDLQNKKITWDISTLKKREENYNLQFKLKVKDNIPADEELTAQIKAHFKISNLIFTKQNSVKIKKEKQETQEISLTPTPSISLKNYLTAYTNIRNIFANSAEIIIVFNQPATYSFYWSKKFKSWNNHFRSLQEKKTNLINLENLEPNTDYYFYFTAKTKNGLKFKSSIFTFKTAKKNIKKLDTLKVIITHNDLILNSTDIPKIITPPKIPLSLTLDFKDYQVHIKQLILRWQEKSKVLGLNTFAQTPAIYEAETTEISNNTFVAKLLSPKKIKTGYQLIARIKDNQNNFYTQILPYQFITSPPLTVLRKDNKKPIEAARLNIYPCNPITRLCPKSLNTSFSYTYYTNSKGQWNSPIPINKYLVKIDSPGFEKKEFILDLTTKSQYPTIYLEPLKGWRHYFSILGYNLSNLAQFLHTNSYNFATSLQTHFVIKHFFLFLSLLLIIQILNLLFHIPLIQILALLYELIREKFLNHKFRFLCIIIRNENSFLRGIKIKIFDMNNKLIYSGKTDFLGRLYIPKKTLTRHSSAFYIIKTEDKHKHQNSFQINSEKLILKKYLHLHLSQPDLDHKNILYYFFSYLISLFLNLIYLLFIIILLAINLYTDNKFTLVAAIFFILLFIIYVFIKVEEENKILRLTPSNNN